MILRLKSVQYDNHSTMLQSFHLIGNDSAILQLPYSNTFICKEGRDSQLEGHRKGRAGSR
ncbi:hypothetical protein Hanom_Chr04g00348631 [Helianthus anomalus]